MNVINKLKEMTEERGWSEYRLVKESGLAPSTISNIFHRNTTPSIYTLEELCKTFDITLSQFFNENDSLIYASEEQNRLLKMWSHLSEKQRSLMLDLIETMG